MDYGSNKGTVLQVLLVGGGLTLGEARMGAGLSDDDFLDAFYDLRAHK